MFSWHCFSKHANEHKHNTSNELSQKEEFHSKEALFGNMVKPVWNPSILLEMGWGRLCLINQGLSSGLMHRSGQCSALNSAHSGIGSWRNCANMKYHVKISLDQGLKVLVPPPQNSLWLIGNQLYVCWNDLDEEVFSCVFLCQYTQLTCQMTRLYYLLWALVVMFWFYTEMSTC